MAEGWLLRPETLVDHFRIMRPLGKGGMAEVYLARDTKLGRKVALKVVKPDALGTKDAVERFLFEARATARFNHPNIVTIYAVGEDKGRPYVALEYLEGETLRQRMEGDSPGVPEALRIATAVAEALCEAHAGAILHRDLKPENVILARDGRLRVLDFGLAGVVPRQKVEGVTLVEEPRSRPGAGVQGTPAYMAPEQWEERETSGVTDVWALGVMLYEMVCGRRPFGETEVVKQALAVCGPEPAPDPGEFGEVRPDLAELISRCLTKNPAGRPTAAEVARRLKEMQAREVQADEEESPFRGLMPFDERHRHFFFGRDAEVAAFLERMRTQPVMPVVGPSGAGKSSFVQAGVIPRMRERGPVVVLRMRPGSDPFLTLATRIATARKQVTHPTMDDSTRDDDTAERLARQILAEPHLLNLVLHRLAGRRRATILLFVDQLEELATLVPDAETRRAFMRAVCAAADDAEMPVRVVLTLREEFLSRLAEDPGVREVMSHVTVLRNPGPESLREILTLPLQAVGYAFDDPSLVERMVAEVQAEVSCLPLLQFAGRMLWDRRDRVDQNLKRSVYEDMGGVAGALAQHADGVLAGMSPGEVKLARSLLLRLVSGEGTRRVLDRSLLLEGLGPEAEGVLQHLTAARLVQVRQTETSGEAELELVHESLAVAWGRLRRWVEESKEELVLLTEIGQAAELWEKRGRRDDEVWTGKALSDVERAVDHCTTEVPSRIQRFLDAGRRKAHRKTWSRRALYASLLLMMAAFALVFWQKERETSKERDRAEAAKLDTEAQRDRAKSAEQATASALRKAEQNLAGALAEKARSTPAIHEALLYAAAALQKSDRPDARGVLAGLLDRPRPRLRWQSHPGVSCLDMQYAPNGDAIACAGWGLRIVDPGSGHSTQLLQAAGVLTRVAWSRDGRHVAAGALEGGVRLWEVGTGRLVWKAREHGDDVVRIGFAADGSRLVSAGLDGSVIAWEPASGKRTARLEGTCEEVWRAAFTIQAGEDGPRCGEASLYLWDAAARRAIKQVNNLYVYPALVPVAYSPGGGRVASWDERETVVLRGAKSGEVLYELAVPEGVVVSLAFSPDGSSLAAACEDGVVRIWSLSTGGEKGRLPGHGGPVYALTWSRDGTTIVTSSLDGTLRKWDPKTGTETARMAGYMLSARCVAPSPDGSELFTLGQMGGHIVWDLRSGRVLRAFSLPLQGEIDNFFRCAWSPAGDRLASVSGPAGQLQIWEAATGRLLHRAAEHANIHWGVAFTPDGKHLVTAARDRTIRLWDVDSGRHLKVLGENTGSIHSFVLSPDGRHLMTSGAAARATLWDLEKGSILQEAEGSKGQNGFAFTPDSRPWVVTVKDAVARIRDLRSGELIAELADQQSDACHLAVSPDGRMIAFGDQVGMIRIWDLEGGIEVARLKTGAFVSDLVFTPDGQGLVTARGPECVVGVWDLERNSRAVELRGHADTVTALAYTPDGKLMTAGLDQSIRTWDTESGREESRRIIAGLPRRAFFFAGGERLLTGEDPGSLCAWDMKTGVRTACFHGGSTADDLAFSPDGRWVVAVSQVYGARLWSAETGEELPLPQEELGPFPTGAAFSPDGETLVIGFPQMSGAVALVDVATRTVRTRFDVEEGAIRFAHSPDGRLLAANTTWFGPSWDIRLLDASTGEVVRTLHGHENYVNRMIFSPDGRRLASWSRDRTTRIWDVVSGKELARLPTAGPFAFSPDGKRLATVGHNDRAVRLWNLDALSMPVDELVEQVRKESGYVLDGLEIVPDPERMQTRFVPVEPVEDTEP